MAVNCWQYAREVYLVGRSVKFRTFTEKERTAVIEFITKMAGTRPAYVPYINLKAGNPPAGEFIGEGEERKIEWNGLSLQNDASLGKMVAKIGRSLKIQFCTEEEKGFCDALFEATDGRRNQEYNGYVTDIVTEEESSTTAEEESSTTAEEESSTTAEEESSTTAEEESSTTAE
jgi:hypothetical protein